MSSRQPGEPLTPTLPPDGLFAIVEQAMMNLWAVVNNLSRIKPPSSSRYRVTIFGSARIHQGDPTYLAVRKLAVHLAGLGCDIVTGGGPGLMQAANEGAQLGDPQNRIQSIGVRVDLPFEQGANPFVEEVYTHQTFFTRLHHFIRLSNAFAVFGGGIGTTLETMMVWQLLQVRHIENVPLVLIGEMWSQLVHWGREYMLTGQTPFASPRDLDIPICVGDVDEACAILEAKVRQHRASISLHDRSSPEA